MSKFSYPFVILLATQEDQYYKNINVLNDLIPKV